MSCKNSRGVLGRKRVIDEHGHFVGVTTEGRRVFHGIIARIVLRRTEAHSHRWSIITRNFDDDWSTSGVENGPMKHAKTFNDSGAIGGFDGTKVAIGEFTAEIINIPRTSGRTTGIKKNNKASGRFTDNTSRRRPKKVLKADIGNGEMIVCRRRDGSKSLWRDSDRLVGKVKKSLFKFNRSARRDRGNAN